MKGFDRVSVQAAVSAVRVGRRLRQAKRAQKAVEAADLGNVRISYLGHEGQGTAGRAK